MAQKIIIDDNDLAMVNSSDKALTIDVPTTASLSGATLPQTITAVEGKVSAMVRRGKCSQSSTPTPASPVDITCNVGAVYEGMLGERLFTQDETDEERLAVPTETLRIYGTNLLSLDALEQGALSGGENYDADSYFYYRVRCRDKVVVKPSTTYTIDVETDTDEQVIYIFFYKTNGTFVGSGYQSLPYTFTTASNVNALRFTIAHENSTSKQIHVSDIVSLQLAEGSSATEVEGYASYAEVQPLLGNYNGTVYDEQNILTGAITRRLGYLVLTGAEIGEWTAFDASNGTYRLQYPTGSVALDEKVNTYILCTHFSCIAPSAGAASIPDGGCKTHTTSHYWYFRKSGISSVSAWVDWLQAQYEAGTPVIVVYEKTTAATEATDFYKMNTLAGSNKIESSSPADATIDMTYNNG